MFAGSLLAFEPGLPAFPQIHQCLEPVVLSRDPLHVAWPVGPACAQRHHMINVPARARAARAARGGAGVLSTEGAHLCAVAFDAGLSRYRQQGDRQPEECLAQQCSIVAATGQINLASVFVFFRVRRWREMLRNVGVSDRSSPHHCSQIRALLARKLQE